MGKRALPRPQPEPHRDDAVVDADFLARVNQLLRVAAQLEQDRRFHEWGDPFLGAWHAYDVARVNGLGVPEWVTEYFDRVARRMLAHSRRRPRGPALATGVLQALEITRRGPSVFSRRATAQREVILATMVADRVATGMKVTAAVAEVAERLNEDRKHGGRRGARRHDDQQTVWRAWRRLGAPSKNGPTL